jgi:hypothetical protein
MPQFFAPLDLHWTELRNAVTQNLAVAPAAAKRTPGLRYYDTVTNTEQYWDGTRWVALTDVVDSSKIIGLGALAYLDQVGAPEIVPGSITDAQISLTANIALSKLAVNPLDRANHTGTQIASTISNFDTQVRTNPINLLAPATGPLDMGGFVITSLGTPSLPSDATTKAYVDSVATGIDIHAAVQVATTANIDVASPPAAIDGYSIWNGDRVLVKDQTVSSENGIYTFYAAGVPMTRTADADVDGELKSGTYVLVMNGNTNGHTGWIVTTPGTITVGTTSIVWAMFSAGGTEYVGTANRITVTGNQIDIAASYVGQASLTTLGTITTGTWNGSPVDIVYGGTGATTPAGARAALGTLGKVTATIGNGVDYQYDVTHNLNSTAVGVELYDVSSGQTVYADVLRLDANRVRIEGFVERPGTDTIGVVVWG